MSDKRRRMVDRLQFNLSKRVRRLILGKLCECCSEREATLGHHVHSKDKNGVLDIQMRCSRCEMYQHQKHRTGNTGWSTEIFRKNNQTILRNLGITLDPSA